jgi:hypothetical protein
MSKHVDLTCAVLRVRHIVYLVGCNKRINWSATHWINTFKNIPSVFHVALVPQIAQNKLFNNIQVPNFSSTINPTVNNVGQPNTKIAFICGVHWRRYLRRNGTRLQRTAQFAYKCVCTVTTATLHRKFVRYLWAVTDVLWSLGNPQPCNPDPLLVRNILGQHSSVFPTEFIKVHYYYYYYYYYYIMLGIYDLRSFILAPSERWLFCVNCTTWFALGPYSRVIQTSPPPSLQSAWPRNYCVAVNNI